jgi:plastin-1
MATSGRRATMKEYSVPQEMYDHFGEESIEQFKAAFGAFDVNGDGSIDASELKNVLVKLGEKDVPDDEIAKMIASVDTNNDQSIQFNEFLSLLKSQNLGKSGEALAEVVNKGMKMFNVNGMSTGGGGYANFSDDEKIAFSEHINTTLQGDPHLASILPLDPNSMDLFSAGSDGILMCKLINKACFDTIDERAINLPNKKPLNKFQKIENQNLAINAAKSIGCTVVNVGPIDLVDGSPILMLGLIWQIVRIQLMSTISLKEHPELLRLLGEGEEMSDMMNQSPEQILLRWFNYQLEHAGSDRRVKNFGSDLMDGECYSILLNRLAPETCPLDSTPEGIIENAKKLGIDPFIAPSDIPNGNKKLNSAFVAQIFNQCPGMDILDDEEIAEYDMAGVMEDDNVEDSREERIFRMWMNSLNIDDTYVNNLFEDVRDGVVLLKVMDKVQPGIVSWPKVNINPKNRFKKVENCNYCVVLAKQMRFSVVNVGGVDLMDGNRTLILGMIWQLMRQHTLNILIEIGGGTKIDDKSIVKWANAQVAEKGKETSMSSFQDSSLSNGRFFLDLLWCLEERVINWDLCTPGESEEDQIMNAKYIISVARKLGCTVFLAPEDITEVKPKMLLMLTASIMLVAMQQKK